MEIAYLEILRRSWEITKQNVHLWWFGFFVTFSGGVNWINAGSDGPEKMNVISDLEYRYDAFVSSHPALAIAIISILAAIFILLFILGIIGRGALIKSIQMESSGKATTFKKGFSNGKRYAARIFFIGLFSVLGVGLSTVIIIMPPAFLFFNGAGSAAIILFILGILILIPIYILFFFLKTYAYIYAVMGELHLVSSLKSAAALFQRKIKESVIMGIILLAVSFLALSSAIAVIGIIFMAMSVFGLFFSFIFSSDLALIIALAATIIIVLVLLLISVSVFETFIQAAWVLFFKAVAGTKTPQEAEEAAIEPVVTPTPESVKTMNQEK